MLPLARKLNVALPRLASLRRGGRRRPPLHKISSRLASLGWTAEGGPPHFDNLHIDNPHIDNPHFDNPHFDSIAICGLAGGFST